MMMMTTTTTTMMMKRTQLPTCLFASSLFCFFFSLLLLGPSLHMGPVHVVASHARHPNLVPSVCKDAAARDPNVDYGFCIRALQSAQGSRGAGVKKLAVIAVKLAKANATATRSYLKKLLDAKVEDKYLKGCLEDCKELYADAASTLKDVKKAVKTEQYDDANTWLSSASEAATTCHQGFEDKPRMKDPLKKRNEDFFQLTVIALCIVNSLAS